MGKEIWAAALRQVRQLCRSRQKRKVLGSWCDLLKETEYFLLDSQNLLTLVMCYPVHNKQPWQLVDGKIRVNQLMQISSFYSSLHSTASHPLRAKLLHFKVVPASLSSPHDVYNAFCRSSTLAVKQGCSHSSGNQKLITEKRPYLKEFLFQAISPTSHLMPEGPSKRAFYSEDFQRTSRAR